MTKLIIKSRTTELTPVQREINRKITDGIIDRFYDASIEGTLSINGTLVNKWIPRGIFDRPAATQTVLSRFPVYIKNNESSSINFLNQDRALNFPFQGGFDGRVFISSLDGFLNLPVEIPNLTTVAAAGLLRSWNLSPNFQSPLLGVILVKKVAWDLLSTQEKENLENLLREWHISKGGRDDDFSSLTTLRSRFQGGGGSSGGIPGRTSFYNWITDFNVRINTSNVTNMRLAFSHQGNIRYLPWMDTSRVTSFESGFNSLTRLEALPLFNTISVTSFSSAFRANSGIRTVPPFNTPRVNNFNFSFEFSSNLKSFPLFNTTAGTFFQRFAWQCALSQQSVDNILISIAAGFAANPTKVLQVGGGSNTLTGSQNAAPSSGLSELRTWSFLEDQTLTLTEGISWTNVQDNKLVFPTSHRLAMAREVFIQSASQASLVGRNLFVCWVSLTEIRLAETLEKALRNEFIEISNSVTGKLYEVYKFNLNVAPWTSLKQIFSNGLTGQQAKDYIATFGTVIQTN
jgi:hypothetical protein